MKALCLIIAGLSLVLPLAAQEAKTAAQLEMDEHRSRIATQRAHEDARYARQRAECYQRFAVNDCLHKARVSRRPLIEELRRQEIILNDEERRQLASEQIQALEDKQLSKSAERSKP